MLNKKWQPCLIFDQLIFCAIFGKIFELITWFIFPLAVGILARAVDYNGRFYSYFLVLYFFRQVALGYLARNSWPFMAKFEFSISTICGLIMLRKLWHLVENIGVFSCITFSKKIECQLKWKGLTKDFFWVSSTHLKIYKLINNTKCFSKSMGTIAKCDPRTELQIYINLK